MFFTFPEDARWNDARSAVEFGVEIGEYAGVVRVPRRIFQHLLSERPTPENCVETYHLYRTQLERVAERKLRRRQLAGDGNVDITGRDLREGDLRNGGRAHMGRKRATVAIRVRGAGRRPSRSRASKQRFSPSGPSRDRARPVLAEGQGCG